MDTKYSTFQAAEILGIEYVRLNEWLRGYFDPEQRAKGRGTRTKFSLNDLYRLKLFALLLKSGLSREMAKNICAAAADKDFSKGFILTATCPLTEAFHWAYVEMINPVHLGKAETTSKDGKKRPIAWFPIQLSIALKIVKELVDSKLPR